MSSPTRPKVSVVVRCLNEEAHIGKLLVGITQQTLKDVEVILVDSGSKDDTLAIAQRFPCRVIHIRSDEFSFGRALNRGIESATGEFLVFASAHVYPVYADWLQQLVKPFADPKVAVSYGKQRGDERTRYSEHQLFALVFPDGPGGIQGTPFCNNANCAIRRSLWEEQPYDETLTGLEDLDWAQKRVLQGGKVAYAPEAEVIHVHEEVPRQILNRYRREAIALKRIDSKQAMSFFSFSRLLVSNVLSDYWHALRDGVFWKNLFDIPLFRFLQFWGAYLGLKQTTSVSEELKRTFYYPRGISRGARHSADPRVAPAVRQKINYGKVL